MTCKELGGACDKEFHAKTFEKISEMSRKHGMDMYEKGDEPHIKAMNEMKRLMSDPEAMNKWIKNKQSKFDSLISD
jgi:hypothetical protein